MAIVSSYVPTFIKTALENNRPVQLTFEEISNTNILSTSSFDYDPLESPLKSTQQLNVDWSKFENHTFFSSAEAKVNVAFDQIINGFPFDGNRREIEGFLERLTGFEKYIFDNFPRYQGQLLFSGTQVGEDTDGTLGTWISVQDAIGALYPEISRKNSGGSVLSPGSDRSLSIEAQVYVPSGISLATQVLLQKLSTTDNSKGFMLYLDNATAGTVPLHFAVVSGSYSLLASASLNRGEFNHICATFNREVNPHRLEIYVNETLLSTTTNDHFIGDLGIDVAPLLIGTGSTVSISHEFSPGTISTSLLTPLTTFSGSLDELRIFHEIRTIEQQQAYASKSLYSTDGLKLYYKFNEPGVQLGLQPTDAVNSIVLDSSGNSLHSTINNYFNYVDTDVNGNITGCLLRQNAADDPLSKMENEKRDLTIVLFPAHPEIKDFNSNLLLSASAFDAVNPNTITKLVPKHYLLEGQVTDGLSSELGEIVESYSTTSGMPGQGKLGSSQLIVTLLYVWAKFFDELKLYVDSFVTVDTFSYEKYDTVPSNFLINRINQMGFQLPPMFNESTIPQYVDGEDLTQEFSTSTYALKYVQSELMRRVLVNMPGIIRSKGTLHSIQSFLRSVGIDPDNSLRIREFGGPTTKQLSFARELKTEMGTMLQFQTSSLLVSQYLTGSRVEPGFPNIAGSFVDQTSYPPHGISNDPNDGLLTSGSWAYEAIYRYLPGTLTSQTQSLIRLLATGSWSTGPALYANLLAVSSSVGTTMKLYVNPTNSSQYHKIDFELPKNIFNSERWNVSFGRYRNDEVNSQDKSLYFIRVSTQNAGEVTSYYSTSSYYLESAPSSNLLQVKSAAHNASGTFLAMGENQSIPTSAGSFLNSTSIPQESRHTKFDGRVSNVRFWSRALSEDEWKEHVRNYKSTGVADPLTNYNFTKTPSGSFGRLRLDCVQKQEKRTAEVDQSMIMLDFSLNENHMFGTGFPNDAESLLVEIFDRSYLSPYYDEAATTEKIRVRGYKSQELASEKPWAQKAPVHELLKSEEPADDVRLSVEFSLVDALNRDIVNMFSTYDSLNNILGAPELAYSSDYPGLENLRDIYFNRLGEKLNFKAFFEFFRWFDTSVGTFIEQLVPRKTRFRGTNFTIESHMLERHKLEYYSSEQYLGTPDSTRADPKKMISLWDGVLSK